MAAPVEMRGSSPSTRSSTGCSAAYASDAPRALSKSSPASMTSAPSARIRSSLPRLAWRDVKTMAGIPSARAAYATPCPKLPAETHAIGRSGPALPSPARPLTATHVPRPLNERIGLTVSTLTMTGTPRRA